MANAALSEPERYTHRKSAGQSAQRSNRYITQVEISREFWRSFSGEGQIPRALSSRAVYERGSYATVVVINPKVTDIPARSRQTCDLRPEASARHQGLPRARTRVLPRRSHPVHRSRSQPPRCHRELATVQKIDGPQLTVRMMVSERGCHAALKFRNQAHLFSILLCGFNCIVTALKFSTVAPKTPTKFLMKFVRDISTKMTLP